jgi:hypothetical protein
MWSGSDYEFSMASRLRPRKSWDIATAVSVALLIALYSVFAVLTFWGALGGFAGAFGVWLCIWIIRQRPGIPVLVLAGIALLLNVAAFLVATAILVAVLLGEI